MDYLTDDYDSLSVVPIEVKSGKDYTVHSALNTFVQNEDYHIKKAFVVSNERKVMQKGKIIYILCIFNKLCAITPNYGAYIGAYFGKPLFCYFT